MPPGPLALTDKSLDDLLRHAEWVESLALQLVRDPARAQDVVQETWRAALERPPRDPGQPRAWLGTVTRNMARKLMRSEERRIERERVAARNEQVPGPDEVVSRASLQQELIEQVLELSDPYRTVVLLRYFEDLDTAEIAHHLGSGVSTVRTQLSRGLAQLRQRLDRGRGGRERWISALLPFYPELARGRMEAARGGQLLSARMVGATAAVLLPVIAIVAVFGPRSDQEPSIAEARTTIPQERRTQSRLDPFAATLRESAGSVLGGELGPGTTRGTVLDLDGQPVSNLSLSFGKRLGPRESTRIVGSTLVIPGHIRTDTALRVPRLKHVALELARSDEGFAQLVSEHPRKEASLRSLLRPDSRAAKPVRTDADGSYVVNGSARGLVPYSLDPDWSVVGYRERVVDSGAQVVIDACVAKARDVRGVVLDEDGAPIPGALVLSLFDLDFVDTIPDRYGLEGSRSFHTFADERGEFFLGSITSWKQLSLCAAAEGFRSKRILIERSPSQDVRFELERIIPIVFGGVVVDELGRAAAGAVVRCGLAKTLSAEDGGFRLEVTALPKGGELTAKLAGYEAARLRPEDPEAGATDLRFALHGRTHELVGRVVDHCGVPLSGLEVGVYDPTPVGRGSREVFEEACHATDDEGAFRVGELAHRDYRLAVFDPLTLALHVTDPIAPGRRTLEVQLPDPVVLDSLSGRLVDRDGAPVAGARVRWAVPTSTAPRAKRRVGAAVSSDEAGRFTLTRIVPQAILTVTGENVLETELAPAEWRSPTDEQEDLRIVVDQLAYVRPRTTEQVQGANFEARDENGQPVPICLRSPSGGTGLLPRMDIRVLGEDAFIGVPVRAKWLDLLVDGVLIGSRSLDLETGRRLHVSF